MEILLLFCPTLTLSLCEKMQFYPKKVHKIAVFILVLMFSYVKGKFTYLFGNAYMENSSYFYSD